MNTKRSFFAIACRDAAFTFLLAGTASLLHAQAQSPVSGSTSNAPILLSSNAAPAAPSDILSSSSSSSSSNFDSPISSDGRFLLSFDKLSSSQPPPRRRYGRPNYSSGNTNPDGSNKWTFMVGAGFTLPTGGTHYYASPSWKFQVGGGRNFNKITGVLLQFDYDHFGMQTRALNNQLALYANLCPSCGFTQLGGNVHDWSFTLNPTFTLPTEGSLGAYVVTGVGFYHKYTQFTVPSSGLCYDPYYGYYQCTANQPVDWYTSNAVGVNGGVGVTWKFSKFSNEKFFAEARYIYTANSRKPYDVSGRTTYFNAFTPASAPTTYIPITFGLRF